MIVGISIVIADSDDWSEASHEMEVTLPWLKLAGVQGLQRVHRATFLLRRYSGGIRIHERVDYSDDVLATHEWKVQDDPSYDPDTDLPIDGLAASNYRLQLSIDPVDPRCESIQFRIGERYFAGPGPVYGRGFEVVGLDLIVGMKQRGGYRHKLSDRSKG